MLPIYITLPGKITQLHGVSLNDKPNGSLALTNKSTVMIAGIGVDLATVSRIKQAHQRFGERFAKRILNHIEWEAYLEHQCKERFLAKRFAVKEAAVKALGTGERQGVLLKDFYIKHDELGKPHLHASGEAQRRCEKSGVKQLWVSLSDEGDTVAAFVVFET